MRSERIKVFQCKNGLVWMEKTEQVQWDQINITVNSIHVLTAVAI